MVYKGKEEKKLSSFFLGCIILEAVGIFLAWKSVADVMLLKHILTFKMQLPVLVFMRGFLRRMVVSKYSLLVSL